jgi:Holliday junction resolvasome RuvABC endonuclease subunit
MERTIRKMSQNIILTNDPSITAWGWGVLNDQNKVLAVGCIKTSPEQKKRRIRKGDDTVRRVSEVVQQLLNIIDKHKVNFLVSELPHGSQNAQAAVMIGIVTGIVQTMSDCLGIPVEWFSEGDAKKAVLNKRSATKTEMIKAIDKLYRVPWANTKYIDEAVADSLAVHYVASKQSSTLKMMKR